MSVSRHSRTAEHSRLQWITNKAGMPVPALLASVAPADPSFHNTPGARIREYATHLPDFTPTNSREEPNLS